MTHSSGLYDLVEDIKMGTAIGVSDVSYDPVTKICSAAWTIKSETGDQWMTVIMPIPSNNRTKTKGVNYIVC